MVIKNYETTFNKIDLTIKKTEIDICYRQNENLPFVDLTKRLTRLQQGKKGLEMAFAYPEETYMGIVIDDSPVTPNKDEEIATFLGSNPITPTYKHPQVEKIVKPNHSKVGNLSKALQSEYKPKKSQTKGQFSPNGNNHNNGYLNRKKTNKVCINGSCIDLRNPELRVRVVQTAPPKLIEHSPIYGSRSVQR